MTVWAGSGKREAGRAPVGSGNGASSAVGSWMTGAAIGVLLVLTVYPLGAVAIQAVFPHIFAPHPSIAFDPQTMFRALTNYATVRMLGDSMLLSVAAAALATLFGGAVAVLVGRTDVPYRSLWTALAWVNLVAPSFLLGQGWELLFERGGVLDALSAVPAPVRALFFSPWGLTLIFALKFFPFAYLAISPALPWLGAEHEAAARTLGARGPTIWRRIYVPLLLPFLASGATLVFANVIQDFGVAATVAQSARFPLISYSIYAAIDTIPTNYPLAGALSVLLLLAVTVALLVQVAVLRRFRYTTIHGGFRPASAMRLGRYRVPITIALGLFFAAALGLPLVTMILVSLLPHLGGPLSAASLTLANYATVLRGGSANPLAGPALLFSMELGVLAATGAFLLGTLLALMGQERSRGLAAGLQGLSLWVISAPAIVLGAGYIFAWNQPWLAHFHLHIYGSVWALILAYLATGLPYALRLQSGALTQLDGRLLAAARVQGAGLVALIRRVILPLVADGSLALWLFLIVEITFELPVSQLLYPPGQPTVAVEILREFNNFDYGPSTALAAISAIVVLVPLGVIRFWVRSMSRRWTPQ